MSTITRLCVGQRLSEASVFNGIVHLGGMVPDDGASDIRIGGPGVDPRHVRIAGAGRVLARQPAAALKRLTERPFQV